MAHRFQITDLPEPPSWAPLWLSALYRRARLDPDSNDRELRRDRMLLRYCAEHPELLACRSRNSALRRIKLLREQEGSAQIPNPRGSCIVPSLGGDYAAAIPKSPIDLLFLNLPWGADPAGLFPSPLYHPRADFDPGDWSQVQLVTRDLVHSCLRAAQPLLSESERARVLIRVPGCRLLAYITWLAAELLDLDLALSTSVIRWDYINRCGASEELSSYFLIAHSKRFGLDWPGEVPSVSVTPRGSSLPTSVLCHLLYYIGIDWTGSLLTRVLDPVCDGACVLEPLARISNSFYLSGVAFDQAQADIVKCAIAKTRGL